MTFRSYRVGSACWLEWTSCGYDDVTSSLEWLRFARHSCSEGLCVVLVIPAVEWPAAQLGGELIEAAHPALQSYCRRLFISLPGTGPGRSALRRAFSYGGQVASHAWVSIFASPDDAFGAAQAESPHDFLALRRIILQESYPPAQKAKAPPPSNADAADSSK
jgi:hypothetical protein